MATAGEHRLPLQADPASRFLCLSPQRLIPLHTLKELVSALGMLYMLHTHIYMLLDNTIPNLLVHDDAHGVFSDVEHASSLAVVELVRHALLNGPIAFNVHDVSPLVHLQVGR